MNLQEFLDFRKYCPVCTTQLTTYFHSHRKQAIKYQDNRLVSIFEVDSLHKSATTFKAGYAFDFLTPTFGMEFWTTDDIQAYEAVPFFFLNRFMELHQNLRKFRFYRDCKFCNQYRYVSSNIEMDFKTATTSPIKIGWETTCVSKPVQDQFQIYNLLSLYNYDVETDKKPYTVAHTIRSNFKRVNLNLDMPAEAMKIMLPLLQLDKPEEVMDRIDKLLVFA